jgi:HSP20 family protein
MTSIKRVPLDRVRPAIDPRARRSEPFPVDVEDRGDEFHVSADLPGLRKQDLDISVRKSRVRITADYGAESESGTYRRRERASGEVSRVVRLPVWVDEKHADASYDQGVLRITLPKRERGIDIEVS